MMAKHADESTQLLEAGPGSSRLSNASSVGLGDAIFKASAVFVFVAMGTGQVLTARASVSKDGSLPYDTSAAVFWVEAIKFLLSLIWMFTVDPQQFVWPIPPSWYKLCFDLSLVAVLYTGVNELFYVVVADIGASLFVIVSNLKIVFCCVFMRLLLGKAFVPLQWLAVSMLTLSAVVVKMPDFLASTDSLPPNLVRGIALNLVMTVCSGLASVINESILKRVDPAGDQMTFMAKNAVLYIWGMALNLASWSSTGNKGLTEGFNAMAIMSVLLTVGLGLSCAVILGYLDNVARCFGDVTKVLLTVAVSSLLFTSSGRSGEFGLCYILALVLLALALVVYQAHENPHLGTYAIMAGLVAGAVGWACMHLRG